MRVKRNLHSTRIEEAFERFDRVETRLDRLEGEAEAFDLGQGRSLADEIGDLAREEAIQNELNALKSRLKKAAAPAKPAVKAKAKAKK